MTARPSPADVKVGQVWASRDRRDAGRRVTVEEITLDYVHVRSVRRSRIRPELFVRTYALVQDVPDGAW